MNEQNNTPVTPVNDGKAFSIAGLVLGCVGCAGGYILSWIPFAPFVILAAAIVGLIMSVKGRKMSFAATGKSSGLATAGLVLSIIGVCLSGLASLTCGLCTLCTTCAYGGLVDAADSIYGSMY